ncbi:cation transporter [Parasporobacterium paucivorans]|uniref:Heavy-metal-associated domain-containing protein n=1 Tax=Parasporobacterium paucivorans DSM 15970 TaxID=1122934 RepID=A0A1M6LCF9_9FIRM|nr:heavy-metal-associated domain-containing protein [Parasporobacterium paucivorans]SHJ68887.1 Heavy-metal-associated domain-containing protein [Parasporobacterium paucivorans DSM 15970]
MEKIYRIENLGCANCAAKMERAIGKIPGVHSVTINFMTQKMILDAEEDKLPRITETAAEKIRKIERQAVLKES